MVAFITTSSWMFLSSFEKLRRYIMQNKSFVSIVDFKIFKGSYVDFMTFISGYSLIMWEAYEVI